MPAPLPNHKLRAVVSVGEGVAFSGVTARLPTRRRMIFRCFVFLGKDRSDRKSRVFVSAKTLAPGPLRSVVKDSGDQTFAD